MRYVAIFTVGAMLGAGIVSAHFNGFLAPVYHRIGLHSLAGHQKPAGTSQEHAGHEGMSMPGMPGMEMPGMKMAMGEPSQVPGHGIVKISAERQQLIGVRKGRVESGSLLMSIRAVGSIEPDQMRVTRLHARIKGWVTKETVNFVGQNVQRGWLAFFGEGEEAGEVPGGHVAVAFPEFRIEDGEGARSGDDDFHGEGAAGAKLLVFADVGVDVDVAVTHAGPADGDAFGDTPDGGVAHVGREHVGVEGFEGDVRVFESPDGVAGIDTGADEVFARLFDEDFEFAALHVAGVVFDGDLEVGVHGAGAAGAEDFDCVLDVAFDGDGPFTVGHGAEEGAD